jgi:Flp pilus assembly protein TadB
MEPSAGGSMGLERRRSVIRFWFWCRRHGRLSVMRRERRRFSISDVAQAQSARLRRRQRWYFALMGTCLALIVLAWNVVRLWSTTAAVAMSVIAAVLVPVAVLIANWGEDH